MELIETYFKEKNGTFHQQREFELIENGKVFCRLATFEDPELSICDLAVVTDSAYRGHGYATIGIKKLMRWAAKNGFKKVTLTDLLGSKAINNIATKFAFEKHGNVWTKSLIGPLNL